MTKQGITIREINGKFYRCRDIGCDDWERAARNRLMVENSLFTTYFKMAENKIKTTPLNKPLPSWVRQENSYMPKTVTISGVDEEGEFEEEVVVVDG